MLQVSLDLATDLFARVAMKANTNKTKAMVGHNGSLCLQLSFLAYKHCLSGEGLMNRESKRQKVSCSHCNKELQAASLDGHIHLQHSTVQQPAKCRKLLQDSVCAPVQCHAFPLGASIPWIVQCRAMLVEHKHAMDCTCTSATDTPVTPFSSFLRGYCPNVRIAGCMSL